MLRKLEELGAFTKVEEVVETEISSYLDCYIGESCFIRGYILPEGTAGDRWADLKSTNATMPIYSTHSSATAFTHSWTIISVDTGLYVYVNGYYSAYFFIGATVDENGGEGMGCVAYVRGSSTNIWVAVDGLISNDTQPVSTIRTTTPTKLQQVSCTTQNTKFKDVFLVRQSPYATERRLQIGKEYFYTDTYGKLAIRFGGI